MLRALVVLFFVGALLPDGGRGVERIREADVVRIPAGSFVMGANDAMIAEAQRRCRAEAPERFADRCLPEALVLGELPAHRVTLDAFAVDRDEVTQAQYARCVLAGACAPTALGLGDPRLEGESLPVVGLSWHDAGRYCAFAGGRLPTEAEWERAARGDRMRFYPWGDTWDPRRANHGRLFVSAAGASEGADRTDGFEGLAPRGAFDGDVSPWGVRGLAGNVREWIADVYGPDYYAVSPQRDPHGPAGSGVRVVRGGSYLAASGFARTTRRDAAAETLRSAQIGVRCVYAVRD